jgi:hypothetical protein
MTQFGEKKVNGHRQFGCGQKFMANLAHDLLEREILRKPLAEHAEKIGLFDIFFGFEHWGSVMLETANWR